MIDRDAGSLPLAQRQRLATIALFLAAAAAATAAAQPPRSGGLVPVPRKTRAELLREWDLNSDGSIDQGEAEVAASRMRRQRAELRLNSGIDPVTGLPRGEIPPEPVEGDIPADEIPADDAVAPAPADERRLPGTRVPRSSLPGSAPAAKPADPAGRAINGSRAAADRLRQPVTGGVRAGGLPARAGYGAGVPAAPLNAGLPIVPRTRVGPQQGQQGQQAPQPGQPRGGLAQPAMPRPPVSRDMYDPY